MKKLNVTKRVILAALISTSLFVSCENESVETVETIQEETAKEAHVCIEKWNLEGSKAASTKRVQWQPGQTIRVKFLNGNSYVQSKVKQYAVEWEDFANVKFEWVSSNSSANIKIGFKEGIYADDGGSWSYLGSDSNSQTQSMHFGWFNNNTNETSFRSTTLHEFGHALGLIHEHQNPVAGINWNREAVYAYYAGPPNNWDRATVDRNLFARKSKNETNYSAYDSKSIMHYPIPAEHTTDGVAVGRNTRLSSTDKSFIARIYPGDTNPPNGGKCDGVAAWNSSTRYSPGDKVTHNGTLYQLGSNYSWNNLGSCDSNRSKSSTEVQFPPL